MSFPPPDAPSYPPVRYRAPAGERSARLHRSDAPPDLVSPATEIGYLATAVQTDGELGLDRCTMTGPPSGPGPHFHHTISESFFVLSGTVQLYDGAAWIDATAGDFLYVPVGGMHAFRNASGACAEMLLLFAPGAPRETCFEANLTRAAAARTPTRTRCWRSSAPTTSTRPDRRADRPRRLGSARLHGWLVRASSTSTPAACWPTSARCRRPGSGRCSCSRSAGAPDPASPCSSSALQEVTPERFDDEIAIDVVFLASDDSASMLGAEMVLDGGWTQL